MAVVTATANPVALTDVKARLNDPSSANDAELQQMLDRALSFYAETVRPVPGAHEDYFVGGSSEVWLPPGASAVTSVVYADGSTAAVTDLRVTESGKLVWKFGTAGYFRPGEVLIRFTVGPIPGHHVEAIVLDVAGLYASTQRGGGGRQFGQFGDGDPAPGGFPAVTMWPRIKALAPPMVG